MRIYIDTANIEHIKAVNELGVISGVTTNPSLIAKEGKDFKAVIKEITSIVDGDIFAEVISMQAEGMVEEAVELSKIDPRIIIKIPMCAEGLKATKRLSKMGIRVNMTLVFSAAQALLASRAGASFVSSFLGRVDDIGYNGVEIISQIVKIFKAHGIDTKVLAASVRHPVHVLDAAAAGVDIATIPYNVIMSMIDHPLTTSGLDRFMKDWAAAKK